MSTCRNRYLWILELLKNALRWDGRVGEAVGQFESRESFLNSRVQYALVLERFQIWYGHHQPKHYSTLLRIMEIRFLKEYLTRKRSAMIGYLAELRRGSFRHLATCEEVPHQLAHDTIKMLAIHYSFQEYHNIGSFFLFIFSPGPGIHFHRASHQRCIRQNAQDSMLIS